VLTTQLQSRSRCLLFCSDFLKERLFGLSNPQGNHGESIKEAHFHVDNTPTVRASLNSAIHKAKPTSSILT
jgi:hypothetical protein